MWGWGGALAGAGLACLQGFLGEGYGSHPQPCHPGRSGLAGMQRWWAWLEYHWEQGCQQAQGTWARQHLCSVRGLEPEAGATLRTPSPRHPQRRALLGSEA